MVQIEAKEPGLISPNISLVYQESSTLETILGDDKPHIEDPLGLLAATVDVRVFETKDTLFYRVYFPDTYLYGSDLIKLLTYTRPNPTLSDVQNKIGILADWRLPDQKDKDSQKRHERHKKAFYPYYSEFVENHRIAFINAVRVLSQEEIRKFFDEEASDLISIEQAIPNLPFLLGPYIHLGRSSILKNYESLRSWLKDTQQDIGPSEILNLSDDGVENLIIEFPNDLRRILIEKGVLNEVGDYMADDVLYRAKNVVDVQGMAGRVKKGSISFRYGSQQEYSIYHRGNGHVEINYGDSWVKLYFDNGIFREQERHIERGEDNAIFPLLVWRVDKNGRTYLSSKVPQQLLDGVPKQADSLVGLITATYLSPEQRDQLPEELSYEEGKYIAKNIHSIRSFSELNARMYAELKLEDNIFKQKIMGAQLPLLALLLSNILVNEIPLFPRVEALYPK